MLTTPTPTMPRRDQIAVGVFATWMIIGLFVDGWAHNAEKPEDFWTPWHAVLYSGFGAAMAWFAWDGRRSGTTMVDSIRGPERLTTLGVALFVASAVGDMVWHEIFGVEEDIEALLSPTHLGLMVGGLFMLTGPVRAALASGERSPSLRTFAPALVTITLATALVAFFLQFDSGLRPEADAFATGASEEDQAYGVVGILLTNVLLAGSLVFVLRNWRPPAGTFTLLFGGVGLLMSVLEAFDHLPVALAVLGGGVVADLLVRRFDPGVDRPRQAWAVSTAVPVATWALWFATYAAVWDFGWTVELWSGSIVLAAATGAGLAILAFPPPGASPAGDQPDGTRQTQNSLPSGSAITHQRFPLSSTASD